MSQYLFCDFNFQSKTETVDAVIKKTEQKLIFINDYSDVQFMIIIKKKMREDLSSFLSLNWFSTSLIMCILLFFDWSEPMKVLHSKHMAFNMNDIKMKKEMMNGLVWLIEWNHTQIIISHNLNDYWILIIIDILI